MGHSCLLSKAMLLIINIPYDPIFQKDFLFMDRFSSFVHVDRVVALIQSVVLMSIKFLILLQPQVLLLVLIDGFHGEYRHLKSSNGSLRIFFV